MKDVQRSVAKFVRRNRLEAEDAHRLLDVVSELGEVAKEVLKGSSYGARRFVPTKEWKDELGDVVFSLMCVANTTGVNLENAVQQVLEKYKRRMRSKGTASSPLAERSNQKPRGKRAIGYSIANWPGTRSHRRARR